jgi:hypothetical protein
MDTTASDARVSYNERTGWTGWIVFAGVMMIIAGSLNALYGVVAAVNDDWVGWTNRENASSTFRNGAGCTSSWASSCCSAASDCSAATSSPGPSR